MPPPPPSPLATKPPPWCLLALLLPMALLGPALLPGKRFLPQLPVMFEPLATENPAAAARASDQANLVASDALFPLLTDELAIRAQLSQGQLPLWDPHLGLGAPLAAGSMAAPWNPLRWPFLWMPPDLARGWHALLALFLAGLGMCLFLRLHVSTSAALFGAIALQASGFAYANLHYLPKFDAALWLPWCLWAIEVSLRRPSRLAELTLFLALASSALAGFPPIFIFVAALSAVWFITHALGAPAPRLVRVASFAALGLLAGAIHLWPMAELASHSTREAQDATRIEAQALAPAALLGLVAPSAFGEATDELPLAKHPVAWGLSRAGHSQETLSANRLEWSLFIGSTALMLALAALTSNWRKWRFPVLALAVCLAFQFGLPGARLLYNLPGFDLGSPARVGALTWILWPWLAALGFDALLRGERAVRWSALLSGALLCASLLLCAAWISGDDSWLNEVEGAIASKHGVSLQELRDYFSRADAVQAFNALRSELWLTALFTASSLGLVLCAKSRPKLAASLLTLLVACGGLSASRSWIQPRSLAPGEPIFPPSATIEAIRQATGTGRVVRIGQDDVLHLARPNLLHGYGIADLTPYIALPDAALVKVLRAYDPGGSYRSGWSAITDLTLLQGPLLDELNVTCLLSREALDSSTVATGRLELVHESSEFHIYRRLGAAARAQLSSEPMLKPWHSPSTFYLAAAASLSALFAALALCFFGARTSREA